MKECKHQFLVMEQMHRGHTSQDSQPMEVIPIRDEFGIRVGCPICGEIRTLWPNGSIVLEVKGLLEDDNTGNTKNRE